MFFRDLYMQIQNEETPQITNRHRLERRCTISKLHFFAIYSTNEKTERKESSQKKKSQLFSRSLNGKPESKESSQKKNHENAAA